MVLALLMMVAMQAGMPPPAPPVPSPLDVADQIRPPLSPPPRGGRGPRLVNLEEVFNADNYPFWARSALEEGHLRFSVEVDAAGRPVRCTIIEKAASEELNQPTCDLVMGQARFLPGTDRRGRPVAGTYSRPVWWRLERKTWDTNDSFQRAILWVDGAGERQCRMETSPGYQLDPRTCAMFRSAPAIIGLMATALNVYAGEREHWELVMQEGMVAAGGPAGDGSGIGSGPDDWLIARARSRLTIDPAGKVTDCTVLEKGDSSDERWRVACDRHRREVFQPKAGGGDRIMLLVSAVYVRGR